MSLPNSLINFALIKKGYTSGIQKKAVL